MSIASILLAIVVILLIIAIGVKIHGFFEGETLITDLIDEVWLARADLVALDKAWAENPRRCDVIVSMTTIPSRLPHLTDTIKSLMRQSVAPRRIVLNIPKYSRREQCAYEPDPALYELAALEIREVEDLGPATKLVPTLLAESSDQAVIALDDDRVYPPRFIETLNDAACAQPDRALALGGWIVPADYTDRPTTLRTNIFMQPPAPVRATRLREPKQIDIMLGFCGYLVRPRFFDLEALSDWSAAPREAFYVDDVWVSAHCRAEKWVLPSKRSNYQPKRKYWIYADNNLGLINRGRGGDENRHNTIVLRHFRQAWRVGGVNLQNATANFARGHAHPRR